MKSVNEGYANFSICLHNFTRLAEKGKGKRFAGSFL